MKRAIPNFSFRLLPLLLAITILGVRTGSPIVDEVEPVDKTVVSFEERLEFYLNENTDELLQQLIANESQLLQLLANIYEEIVDRGQEGMLAGEAGFDLVHKEADSLILEYSKEMAKLLQVYDNLAKMEKLAVQSDQLQEWENLLIARQKVAQALEDRALFAKRIYNQEAISETVEEYATELDSLLSIFNNLERLEVHAFDRGDTATVAEVARQKGRIINILSKWGPIGPLTENRYNQYVEEVQKLQDIVHEIEEAQNQADTTLNAVELKNLKKDLVGRLDDGFLDLFIHSGYKMPSEPRVSEIVDEWKRERISDFNSRIAQYQVVRKNLIETATDKELERMLSRELGDALLNYSEGKYVLSENQLTFILDGYSDYFKGLDAVLFYRGECQFATGAFTNASATYRSLAENFPSSSFRVESLLRLMEISLIYESGLDFYTYFKELRSHEARADVTARSKAYYLAGNQNFSDKRFEQAAEVLRLVSTESTYYLPSRLLLGVVEVNLDHNPTAITIFQKLSELESYPWTDLNTAYIRNTASLRLGMIYYQRGEYTRAVQHFDRISQGFEEYDESLIAHAWANLRLGKYESSIEKSHQLLLNTLASDYTYEALVLSAHCKRILDQSESALNAYRYVAGARGIMELKNDYDQERRFVLAQIGELDRIEQKMLDKRQDTAYPEIQELRSALNEFMLTIRHRSDRGTHLIQDYYDERKDIIDHLRQLDDIVEWAEQEDRPDLVQEAATQRLRLINILETYNADQRVVNTSYLVDYPLAAKEANVEYRQEIIGSMYREMQMEARRIENALELAETLKDTTTARDDIDTKMDLGFLQSELTDLRTRLDRFRHWVVGNTPSAPASNIDKWSDMSGFGMSDIVHEERKTRIDRIDNLTQNISEIDRVLQLRRQALEAQLAAFEDRLLQMQEVFLSRKIEYEKQERQTYFDSIYFETKEREEDDWEDRLQHLINP